MTVEEFIDDWHSPADKLLVHTSGSTGKPKPLWVEKKRMEASARITCSFLGLKAGESALLCMPLDFIAGKMIVVRSIVCGLRLVSVPPSGHPFSSLVADGGTHEDEPFSLVAMVPMQVYNTLRCPKEREALMRVRNIIIGGGAIDEALEKELRTFPNAVWSTYGMTETLSHIALRRINGPEASQWYTPFENVSVSLNADDCLAIDAPAVCSSLLVTNDCAEIAPDGRRFRILGRKDNVICSGGIKIQIEEVERKLCQCLSVPFMITKRKDAKFGEIVVLLAQSSDMDEVRNVCKRVLPPYWQPRLYASVESLPMTATGKPARAEAERIASGLFVNSEP